MTTLAGYEQEIVHLNNTFNGICKSKKITKTKTHEEAANLYSNMLTKNERSDLVNKSAHPFLKKI